MTVTIDWNLVPWKPLNAHAKGHWRAKSAATKKFRGMVNMLICTRKERFETAEIQLSFYIPDARHRDTLNMAQSLKPAIDALVDQGILKGDEWNILRIGRMHVEIDRLNPRVEIRIESGC